MKRLLKVKSEIEEWEDIKFNIHKFNNKKRSKDIRRTLLIGCFSEFGSEIIGCMYCIPRILQLYPGNYTIAVGWYGREYLYRHLVDEFWEIKKEHQHLRDYCRAFHHVSKNLERVEKALEKEGRVMSSSFLGQIAVGNLCRNCRHFWGDITKVESCPHCQSVNVIGSFFGNVSLYKSNVIRIPLPSQKKIQEAKGYLKNNAVGIFARNRKTYGRNLQPEFYIQLIKLLEDRGYSPIWLGEEQTTHACPVGHITDMSRRKESQDLELTLAIVSQLKFTVQFWTASTRLAAIMGTPYLIFESPEQIFGKGQEGFRLNLASFSRRKMCLSHYLNVYNNHDEAIELVGKCISEMVEGNYEDVIGMVDNKEVISAMRLQNLRRIGTEL